MEILTKTCHYQLSKGRICDRAVIGVYINDAQTTYSNTFSSFGPLFTCHFMTAACCVTHELLRTQSCVEWSVKKNVQDFLIHNLESAEAELN